MAAGKIRAAASPRPAVGDPIGKDSTEAVRWAMNYVHCMYDAENTQPGKGVDTSGKDLVRACFLCHDPKALLRKVVNFEL